jgi:coenzyme F420-0:L-glutamate ligase/coenzyme F420-1:gamma-L-glutamate ligase
VSREIRLVAMEGIPAVAPGDDLAALHQQAALRCGISLRGGVLAVCQKIVSKAEGRVVPLAEVEPSPEARAMAAEDGKAPRQVEMVMGRMRTIVRSGGRTTSTSRTRTGYAPGAEVAVLLPEDPDASAERLREGLVALGAGPLAVIVTDTFGRPWREGLVDVAIGCAGIAPIDDLRGTPDLTGRELAVTTAATADQLAAAAGLHMRKDSGIPSVWIEGIPLEGDGPLRDTLREPETDLFR